KTIPTFDISQWADTEVIKDYIRQLLSSGPVKFLLYPFHLLVRPYFASGATAFASALPAALALLLLHYWWVLRMDVSFEEASVEASRKAAEKISAMRAGRWQSSRSKPRGKRPPFNLRPVGPAPIALLWKNLISAGQVFNARTWITLAVIVVGTLFSLRGSFSG